MNRVVMERLAAAKRLAADLGTEELLLSLAAAQDEADFAAGFRKALDTEVRLRIRETGGLLLAAGSASGEIAEEWDYAWDGARLVVALRDWATPATVDECVSIEAVPATVKYTVHTAKVKALMRKLPPAGREAIERHCAKTPKVTPVKVTVAQAEGVTG